VDLNLSFGSPVALQPTRFGSAKHYFSRISRKAKLATVGLLAAIIVVPVMSISAAGAQTVKTQGDTPISYSVGGVCGGTLAFSGTQHYNTEWTLTGNGQLNFHWVANIKGTATINGATYIWQQNNHEIDHLDIRGAGPGFNADGTPNLATSGGSLVNWLNNPANYSHVDQVSSLFYDRLVLQGGGSKLQNQFVISVNMNGNPNALQLRYVSGLC